MRGPLYLWNTTDNLFRPASVPSVRVSSKKTYNAGTLFLADIQAMPTGCATWPAYWTVGPNWPNGGEVDIIGMPFVVSGGS